MRAKDLINLEGAASAGLRDQVLDCSQLFDPLPECNLDVRHVVDGERVHVCERTARDVHVVADQRLDPGLVREQRFEVLPLVLDDRPEIDEEDVVDLPRWAPTDVSAPSIDTFMTACAHQLLWRAKPTAVIFIKR